MFASEFSSFSFLSSIHISRGVQKALRLIFLSSIANTFAIELLAFIALGLRENASFGRCEGSHSSPQRVFAAALLRQKLFYFLRGKLPRLSASSTLASNRVRLFLNRLGEGLEALEALLFHRDDGCGETRLRLHVFAAGGGLLGVEIELDEKVETVGEFVDFVDSRING